MFLGLLPGSPAAGAPSVDGWDSISAGEQHTCGIDADEVAWCWGNDAFGQLGNGQTSLAGEVARVYAIGSRPDHYLAISAGTTHTCGIATDHTAWCWGFNDYGQLGNGGVSEIWSVPVAVSTAGALPDTYTAITAGAAYTCAIATGGSVWCWGAGGSGQLGNGSVGDVNVATAVDTTGALPDTYKMVAASPFVHTCAIAANDTAWCWGQDDEGQLGDGGAIAAEDEQYSPVAVSTTGALPDTYSDISVGFRHSCAIAANSTAWCWGYDDLGQLGNGAGVTASQSSPMQVDTTGALPDTYVEISAGGGGDSATFSHTCARNTDGSVWCWGSNAWNQVGGTSLVQPVPLAVSFVGLLSSIEVGAEHSCALFSGGSAWCWGRADDRLGHGWLAPNEDDAAPLLVQGLPTEWATVAAGSGYTTCALDSDDAAWCWGYDSVGQVGDDLSLTNRSGPVRVDTSGSKPDAYIAITTGSEHVCGLDPDGAAWCWGSDLFGQLGNGSDAIEASCPVYSGTCSYTPVAVAGGHRFVSIDAGDGHTCAIDTDQAIWCWGHDDAGQLGDGGGETDQASPVAVLTGGALPSTYRSVSAGGAHTCAVDTDSRAWCWGSDSDGQLGNGGESINQSIPIRVVDPDGYDPESDLGFDTVTAGYGHTCAYTWSGTACWGDDAAGQLGNGTPRTDSQSPVLTSEWLSPLSADNLFSCGSDGGAILCWGSDYQGKLGNGATLGDGTCTFGSSYPCAPSPVSAQFPAWHQGWFRTLAAGADHACTVDWNGLIFCWGDDTYGGLGNGSTNREPTFQAAPVAVPYAGNVTKATCKRGRSSMSYVFSISVRPGSTTLYRSLEIYQGYGYDAPVGLHAETLRSPSGTATFRGRFSRGTYTGSSLRFVLEDIEGHRTSALNVRCG